MESPPPGSLLSTTCTPGTLSAINCWGLAMVPGLKSSALNWLAEVVRSPARLVPYPTTTTDARLTARAVIARSTVIVSPPATVTACVAGAYPMSRARTLSLPAGTSLTTYRPSARVTAARLPTVTETPASGCCVAALLTRPWIVPVACCAPSGAVQSTAARAARIQRSRLITSPRTVGPHAPGPTGGSGAREEVSRGEGSVNMVDLAQRGGSSPPPRQDA